MQMSCTFDEKLLYLFIDNELPPDQRTRVIKHIEQCHDCTIRIRTLTAFKNSVLLTCQIQTAPPSLKARIQESLDSQQSAQSLSLSFAEKIRMLFSGFRPMQAAVAGIIVLIMISFIFIPGNSPANHLADTLALEHLKHRGVIDESGIQSTKGAEIAEFLGQQVGQKLDIPDCMDSDLCVNGGFLENINLVPVAHIIYKNGKINCSLFVITLTDSSSASSNMLLIKEDTFQVGHSNQANYVCWREAAKLFILVGSCPQEKLMNLAKTSI
jgi:anti-sigma factor RsiW